MASPSPDFQYFPGEPTGYAGYTDRVAMQQTITDDLVDHDAAWQFRTIGFAKGFLGKVLQRIDRSEGVHSIFRLVGTNEDDVAAVGWMALMQTQGTDNAYPSTFNLKSGVDQIASEMSVTGPCRAKFWDRVEDSRKGNPEKSRIALERLSELTHLMRNAACRGEMLAASAQIVPWASDPPRVSQGR